MTEIFTLENKIKQIIDELKGLCQTNGLSNQASEEVVITSVFLYKFLNDKFMANLKEFAEEMHWDVNTYRKIETGCSLLTSDKAQMLYDKYEIDITYLLTGNKPDFDNHLRQLWLTASRVEKKLILARLISYVEEML